jgi:hypothetical protein
MADTSTEENFETKNDVPLFILHALDLLPMAYKIKVTSKNKPNPGEPGDGKSRD